MSRKFGLVLVFTSPTEVIVEAFVKEVSHPTPIRLAAAAEVAEMLRTKLAVELPSKLPAISNYEDGVYAKELVALILFYMSYPREVRDKIHLKVTIEKIQEVLLVPLEAIRVAEGNPVVCIDTVGREVRLRIPTLEEARKLHQLGRDSCVSNGGAVPDEPATDEELKKLIRPYGFRKRVVGR